MRKLEGCLTIKELIEKLQWSIDNGYVEEDNYVFYSLPNEDEGSLASLRPVVNIANPSIIMFRGEDINNLLNRESICLCFVKPQSF